jgi:diacylglycerol kinase family enzyme
MLRDAAGMNVTVHKTRSPGHATSVIASLDLDAVDMLVFVGGDGTVFEGLQV